MATYLVETRFNGGNVIMSDWVGEDLLNRTENVRFLADDEQLAR